MAKMAFTDQGVVVEGDITAQTKITGGRGAFTIDYTYQDTASNTWTGFCHFKPIAPAIYRGEWRDTSGPPSAQRVDAGQAVVTGHGLVLSGSWTGARKKTVEHWAVELLRLPGDEDPTP